MLPRLMLLSTVSTVLAGLLSAQPPLLVLEGSHAGAESGSALAMDADLSGDGVPDLIIGQPGYDTTVLGIPLQDAGRVVVIDGATGEQLWQRSGFQSGERLGAAVAFVDDLTGDGRAEVLVGRPGARLQVGPLSVTVGGFTLYSGLGGTVMQEVVASDLGVREFGRAVTGTGDLDQDGVPDFAVGSPFADPGGHTDAGAVHLYSGATLGEFDVIESSQEGSGLGWSLDGRTPYGPAATLLVGEPFLLADRGRARLFAYEFFSGFGAPVLVDSWLAATPGSLLGWSVAHLGDAGGALADDVALGAPGSDRVLVASIGGSILEVHHGDTAGEEFGWALDSPGDSDGDGLAELVVGAPGHDGGRGAVVRLTALAGTVLSTIEGTPASRSGSAVVSGGDLDGDGTLEFAVGAPLADGQAGSDAGLVTVYRSGCHAQWSSYGNGLAGTLGVPALVLDAAPVLGAPVTLTLGNTSGGATQGLWLLGLEEAALPFKGGTLWLQPQLQVLLALPASGLELATVLPADPALCGVRLLHQLVVADPGAALGVALSPGLDTLFGEP